MGTIRKFADVGEVPGGFPAFGFNPDEINQYCLRMDGNGFGCIGITFAFDQTARILAKLRRQYFLPHHVRTLGNITTQVNGDIKEFNSLKHGHGLNARDKEELFLQMVCRHPDTTAGVVSTVSYINYSEYTLIVGKHDERSGHIWLVRDGKPLYIADLRTTLGQIFWFQQPGDWQKLVSEMPVHERERVFSPESKIIEMNDKEIWDINFTLPGDFDEDHSKRWNIHKFKYSKTKYIDWTNDSK